MTEANKHAELSASGCHRWLDCPASVVLTSGMAEESSPYAEEGTKAHRLAELTLSVRWALMAEKDAAEEIAAIKAELPEAEQNIEQYERYIASIEEGNDVLMREVEMRLSITGITGEPNAFGTADCVLITRDMGGGNAAPVLHIVDLKYGAGVPVKAEKNSQLAIYGLAALNLLDVGGELLGIDTVVLHIVQPRMDNFSTWSVSREELEKKFLPNVRRASNRARYLLDHPEDLKVASPFRPTSEKGIDGEQNVVIPSRGDFANPADADKVCKWCKAKATCPNLRKQLAETLAQEFDDLPPAPIAPEVKAELTSIPVPDTPERLAAAYRYVSMIRQWCDAVEDSTRKNLAIGTEVPGWKLVAGRQGARKWRDPKEAEEILRRALRVDSVYDRKVISPTSAEKLMKEGLLGPRYWTRLNALISRADGKPAIVPADDPRDAIVPQIENDFD